MLYEVITIINNENNEQVAIMVKLLKVFVLGISALLLAFPVCSEEVSKEQLKGLDEQVQEIKSDVLGIAVELNQLERNNFV